MTPTTDDALRPPPGLDANYRPFKGLREWYDKPVDLGIFDTASAMWAARRREADASLVPC